jgi:hypothetical protein
MTKNGHLDLYQRTKRIHNLSWHDFKLSCGFNDFDRNKKYTLEEDQQSYIDLRNNHPEARSSSWMKDNGYNALYRRVSKMHKLSWNEFKKLCGFND